MYKNFRNNNLFKRHKYTSQQVSIIEVFGVRLYNLHKLTKRKRHAQNTSGCGTGYVLIINEAPLSRLGKLKNFLFHFVHQISKKMTKRFRTSIICYRKKTSTSAIYFIQSLLYQQNNQKQKQLLACWKELE